MPRLSDHGARLGGTWRSAQHAAGGYIPDATDVTATKAATATVEARIVAAVREGGGVSGAGARSERLCVRRLGSRGGEAAQEGRRAVFTAAEVDAAAATRGSGSARQIPAGRGRAERGRGAAAPPITRGQSLPRRAVARTFRARGRASPPRRQALAPAQIGDGARAPSPTSAICARCIAPALCTLWNAGVRLTALPHSGSGPRGAAGRRVLRTCHSVQDLVCSTWRKSSEPRPRPGPVQVSKATK